MAAKLGDILVEKGIINQQQLDAAIAVQGEQQIGQVLINWGWLTQEQLLEALDVQAPPPPPPPPPPVQPQIPQQPMYQQPPVAPPSGTPDLTMDTLQSSKFKIDLKTMIWIGSMLVSGITMYFTFMGELDDRFGALEGQDKDLMVDMEKRMVDLENRFTPIGEGVYSVDPNSTWPPTRQEYKMKDEMSRNMLIQIQEDIEDIKKDIEKIERKVFNGKH
tara:strand:- start:898 stop:1551 length:654 start_codon:yes stop_codon:yes gene_type:complete